MELNKTQETFIKSWGSLGSQWGLNKTLAQIHALFLISDELLSAEEIMETLKISRGNVNMNVRTLIDWGLVYKDNILGERKEFFKGEKDLWLVFKRVMKVRKEKELDPMLELLREMIKDSEQLKSDKKTVSRLKEIEKFAEKADNILERMIRSDENLFWSVIMKFIK